MKFFAFPTSRNVREVTLHGPMAIFDSIFAPKIVQRGLDLLQKKGYKFFRSARSNNKDVRILRYPMLKNDGEGSDRRLSAPGNDELALRSQKNE